mmetsp:Transcript_21405/g.63879  ORF Transcript_21405/g.63879 Transcript_21405/m.63879 type:complete len:584 (-) Transcript_21405:140-1891(-)
MSASLRRSRADDEGGDRVRDRFVAEGVRADLQAEGDVPAGLVQSDDDNGLVRVRERRHLQSVPTGRARDAVGSRLDEPRELADVVERRHEHDPVLGDVADDGRRAPVADVVVPATGVEDEIPVDPGLVPAVEVAEDALRVALPDAPVPDVGAELLAHLRDHQVLLEVQLLRQPDVVEAPLAGGVGPPLVAGVPVPVPAHAPDVLGGLGVGVDDVGPAEELVPVVVPGDDLQVHAAGLERGPEVVPDEVALGLRAVEAVLPRRLAVRLVLHGEAPEREAGVPQLLREAHVELRPRAAAVLLEAAALAHGPGVLHPRRGAPGAGEEHQGAPGRGRRAPHHGEHGLVVAVDAERLQLRVVLPVAAAPVAPGEVAGVHVQAADLVVEPHLRAEVALDDSLLALLPQLEQELCRGLREGPAEAHELLVAHGRVHAHGDLPLVRHDEAPLGGADHAHPLACPLAGAHGGDLALLRRPDLRQRPGDLGVVHVVEGLVQEVADLRRKLRPLLAQDPPHEPRRLPPRQGPDAQIQEHQQEGRRALQEDGRQRRRRGDREQGEEAPAPVQGKLHVEPQGVGQRQQSWGEARPL